MTAKPKKIAPIPHGFRSITPHITTTDVSAAIALYERAFGASVASTETVPGTDAIIFARVKIGNSQITIGQGEVFGPGFVSLHHYVEDADAIWEAAISAGFTELRALEETYWGDRMGHMIDPLGVRWSIAQRVVRLNAEERDERARAALGYPMPEAVFAKGDESVTEVTPVEAVIEGITAPKQEVVH